MQVGVKSEWKIPERLYGDNSTGYRLLVPDAGCVKGFQRLPAIPPGREGQKAGCVLKKIPPQDFGDAQYRMPVRNRLYHLLTKPLAELYHPLLVTGWTEMATLARKCQEIFMTTVLTSDPGKAIFQKSRCRIINNA